MVGGPEEAAVEFACDGGFITNGQAHNGAMPDEVATWLREDDEGGLAADPGITCTAQDGEARSVYQAAVSESVEEASPQPHETAADSLASIPAAASRNAPALLYLTVPNDADHCAGLYRLIPDRLFNGFPIWQFDGEEQRWLYSSQMVRTWMVGGPEEAAAEFACDVAYITNIHAHNGAIVLLYGTVGLACGIQLAAPPGLAWLPPRWLAVAAAP